MILVEGFLAEDWFWYGSWLLDMVFIEDFLAEDWFSNPWRLD
jgi:hypothetical protein